MEGPRFDIDIDVDIGINVDVDIGIDTAEEEEVGNAEKASTGPTDEDNNTIIIIGASEATAMMEKQYLGIVSFFIVS